MNEACPYCGQPRRQSQGMRGVAPNYTNALGYRCSNPDCALCGYLIYPDKEQQPSYLEWLSANNVWYWRRKEHINQIRSNNVGDEI